MQDQFRPYDVGEILLLNKLTNATRSSDLASLLFAVTGFLLPSYAVAGFDGSAFQGIFTLFATAAAAAGLLLALAIRGVNRFFRAIAAVIVGLGCLLIVFAWYVFARELQRFGPLEEPAIYAVPSLISLVLLVLYLKFPVNNKWIRNVAAAPLLLACGAWALNTSSEYFKRLSNEQSRTPSSSYDANTDITSPLVESASQLDRSPSRRLLSPAPLPSSPTIVLPDFYQPVELEIEKGTVETQPEK